MSMNKYQFTGSGNPIQYPSWKVAFDKLINNSGNPLKERLLYLSAYRLGKTKEFVEGYFLLSSDDAYSQALGL